MVLWEKLLKGEALVIAFLSLAGWGLTFAFECGALFYFDMPFSFAEVSVAQAALALCILTFVAAVLSFTDIWSIIWKLIYGSRLRTAVLLLVCFCGMLALFLGGGSGIWSDLDGLEYRTLARWLAAGMLLGFFVPFFVIFIPAAWSNTGKQLTNIDAEKRFSEAARNKIGMPLASAGVVWFIAFFIGYVYAVSGGDYYVLDEKPNFVLVRKYGDTYIFKDTDAKERIIRSGIKVIKVGDGKTVELTKVRLGMLSSPSFDRYKRRLQFLFYGTDL